MYRKLFLAFSSSADERGKTEVKSVIIYGKYTKDTTLASIATIILSLKGIILLPILTKALGAELYGIWSQILVTIALLTPLALLQLNQAMIRFLAAEEDKRKVSQGLFSIFSAISIFTAILSFAMFIIAKPLAIVIFGDANAQPFIQIAAFVLFLNVIDQVVLGYFRAFRQMKKYSIFITLQTVIEISLITYFVLSLGLELSGALYSLLVAKGIILIVGLLLIISEIKIVTPSITLLKPYLAFSLPLIPFMLCAWIVTLSDRYIIGYFMNMNAVGVYSAAYSLGNLVQLFIAPFWIVLFPTVTNLYEHGQIQEIKTHLKYSLKLFLMFAIPVFFGLSVLSQSLLDILTTSEFSRGYLIIPIVSLAVVLFGSSSILGNTLMLLKKTKTIALIYGGSALINIMLNIALVPSIGILGAAIATLATFTLHLIVISKISYRRLLFGIDLKFIIKSIISSLVMGVIVSLLNFGGVISIIISIVSGVVTYFGTLILLKGFTRGEYIFLKNILRSVF
ncbi:flippase [Chloroflexota bacterium]